MLLFPIDWERVSAKTGDDITIVLSPVQRSLLIGAMMNIQYIGEHAPQSMKIGEDSDNFDAVVSDLMSKLAVSE